MSKPREPFACQENPDWFFSKARQKVARAKAACAHCPVREACAQYALETGERYGIWGGLDETERKSLRRNTQAKGTAA